MSIYSSLMVMDCYQYNNYGKGPILSKLLCIFSLFKMASMMADSRPYIIVQFRKFIISLMVLYEFPFVDQ